MFLLYSFTSEAANIWKKKRGFASEAELYQLDPSFPNYEFTTAVIFLYEKDPSTVLENQLWGHMV